MKYFKLSEFYKSSTAETFGIDNLPPAKAVDNIQNLVDNVLDIIREKWGSPIIVTSGYRCKELNDKVKGSKTSHHMCNNGYAAADIKAKNGDNLGLLELIKKMGEDGEIKYCQLINEYPKKEIPSWIHISANVDKAKNKMQYLVIR